VSRLARWIPREAWHPPTRRAMREGRPLNGSSPTARPPAAGPAAGLVAPGGGAEVAPADLLERRQALARELAELQWDLGGLAYEMAIRNHFRPDVIMRVAARLQQVDAELGEVERLVRMEEAGAAGTCPSCGALHGRGAVFCWQCGTQLMATTPA
jgi:hypothetical protein